MAMLKSPSRSDERARALARRSARPIRHVGIAHVLSLCLLFVLLIPSNRCGPKFKPGELKWKFDTEAAIGEASPSIAPDGTIYCGSTDWHLYALTPEGKLKWRFEAGGPVTTNAAIADDGTIYFGAESSFYAVNPGSTLKWRFPTRSHYGIPGSVAIADDGTVYCPAGNECLLAVNPDGTQKWSAVVGGIPRGVAVGPDGTIYTSTSSQSLATFAIRPDGSIKWRDDHPSGLVPAIGSDSTIYTGSDHLYAYRPDGSIRLRFPYLITSPAAIGPNGTLYFGYSSAILAIQPDGSKLWEDTTGNNHYVYSAPALCSDGTVYFGSDDGLLRAVDRDGVPLWEFKTGEAVRSTPAIASDGTVYLSSTNGSIYAIQGSGHQADSPWPVLSHDSRRTGRFGAQ